MQIMPYKRPPNPITDHVEGDGRVRFQRQQDICPICHEAVEWQRECHEHYQTEDGAWIPAVWESWHAECTGCASELIDAYEDGLIHVHDLVSIVLPQLPAQED